MARPAQKRSLIDRLTNIPRQVLYLVLIVGGTIPLFVKGIVIPVRASQSSIDFYRLIAELPEGSTVFIQSDWTNSSRGESAGHLEALYRILMARNLKFVVYTLTDPQAPQVARDVLNRINNERASRGLPRYRRWEDYLELGFFPDGSTVAIAMQANLRNAWQTARERDPETGELRNVFESPVLRNVQRVGDAKAIVVITASASYPLPMRAIRDTPTMAMVTGVMGPEALNFYDAGLLKGLVVGLRGTTEIETMMSRGVNYVEPGQTRPFVRDNKDPASVIPPLGYPVTYARGMQYFLSFHVVMTLMILAVIAGNATLFARRRSKRRK